MDISKIAPSFGQSITVKAVPEGATVTADSVAVLVPSEGELPSPLKTDLATLKRAGFEPETGQSVAFPSTSAHVSVAVGIGDPDELTIGKVRDAAASFARAVPHDSSLAMPVPVTDSVSVADAAAAIVEGAVLARYDYSLSAEEPALAPLVTLTVVGTPEDLEQAQEGAERGLAAARATSLARDLATAPPVLLTAPVFGEVAEIVGAQSGLEVEVHDKASIDEMGLGGLLGVNRGSAREPRLIILRYRPSLAEGEEATGHLALVGKGITYDSGGISLKPANASHAQMKTDMTGAGDVLGAMSAMRDLGVTAEVTGYLVATDNMPSGPAMQLGDVLTMRNGKTVEVLNTDAEGRLVLADGLALASEGNPDAIVDIATLTGAAARTFGEDVAAAMSNSPALVEQVIAAGEKAGEPACELPLWAPYRDQLKSDIADLKNIGAGSAGTIIAALFLEEFVGDAPWAHLDIAGTSWASKTKGWVNAGPTAFGARLLLQLAADFQKP